MPRRYFGLVTLCLCTTLGATTSWGTTTAVEVLLQEYAQLLAVRDRQGQFDPSEGEKSWYNDNAGRSCTSCHGNSLHVPGRHEKTGKVIEPMAPSTNAQRLTDTKKIKKWLLRNCKWTYGRVCTPQEKGDFLSWLSTQ
jgi:hypothetical protein